VHAGRACQKDSVGRASMLGGRARRIVWEGRACCAPHICAYAAARQGNTGLRSSMRQNAQTLFKLCRDIARGQAGKDNMDCEEKAHMLSPCRLASGLHVHIALRSPSP